jgi:hypothetical protein
LVYPNRMLDLQTPRRATAASTMSCVATWADGPEYAPIERPFAFQNPDAPPLKIAAPYPQMAALAPKSRPVFDSPEKPVAPLSTLLPAREEPRDPQEPFAVVSTTMTTDSAWGAAHWAAPTSPAGARAAVSVPPPGAHYPRPDQPLVVQSGNSPTPGNFPAPGSPSWWGPGPPARQPRPTIPVTARAVLDAATPGLCICLLIGGLVYIFSPIVLWIGIGLLARVKVAKDEVRRTYRLGIVALAVIGFLGTFIVDTGLGDWWRFVATWGLVICWGLLVSTLILVYRRLKSNSAPPAPYRSRWR